MLGNIERTSGLYLNKTVYAMLISLATGVLAFVFPFLPRHLTLIGAVTIGIPSFFLALAPNTDRFRPGFVRRVLRFAIPTGTLASIATLLAYWLAREEPGVTLMEAQTTAVMVLTWIGLLVLTILSAPLTRARLALIWTMAGLFIVALTWGPTEDVLRARSAAADRVARRLRHRGDRLVVRPPVRAGGGARRPPGPRRADRRRHHRRLA